VCDVAGLGPPEPTGPYRCGHAHAPTPAQTTGRASRTGVECQRGSGAVPSVRLRHARGPGDVGLGADDAVSPVLDVRADEVKPGDYLEEGRRVAAVTWSRTGPMPAKLTLDNVREVVGQLTISVIEILFVETSEPLRLPPSTPVRVLRAGV
jgi:hypothetical protein